MRQSDCLLKTMMLLALLWSLGEGAVSAQGPTPIWTTYTTSQGLAADAVSALAIGEGGEVWVGTYGGGVSLFDGDTWISYAKGHGLGDDWVTALAIAPDGTVWAGTWGGGVSWFDGERWETYNSESSGLVSDWVTDLAVDGESALWVGTYGGGVSVFDGHVWRTYNRANSGLASDWVTALALDGEGTLWVGTSGKGVSRLDGETWATYTTTDGLASNTINVIAADGRGRVWIGTDEGASVFDGQTWTTYTAEDGLAHDSIHAIAFDADGNAWFGTSRGASHFDGQTWTTYTSQDGLAHDYVQAIAVDQAGNLWFGTMGGLSKWGAPGAIPPSPYPVVFVHGWRGPESDSVYDSQFKFLRRWLARDGIASFFATGIRPENTLYQNAQRLRDVIAQVRTKTGAPQVNIVAHSMGGLNVRAYTESALYQDDVAQVFMLGTPQAGVHLWKDLLVREIQRGSREPSARELLPEHMALFNRAHRNVHDIPYHLIIGDIRRQPALEFLDFWPPNDGLITVWSAHALDGPTVRQVTTDDVHGWSQSTILFDLPSYLWPADDYKAYLRNELRLSEEAPIPISTKKGPEEPPQPENHTPYLWGEIRSGQVVTHTVEIDPHRSARFYLLWRWGDADLTLTDPRGEIIDPERAQEEDRIEHFSLEADVFANLEIYSVEGAPPGTWTLTIEGVDLPAGGVDYVAYAVLESDLSLAVATDKGWVRRGEAVTITATVFGAEEPLPGATVRAEITRPDAVTHTLALHDDGAHGDGQAGDGVYGTFYTAEVGGYTPIVVSASGAGYQRAQAMFIVVSPETARLTGSYADYPTLPPLGKGRGEGGADGDGVYGSLIVDVGVQADAPGEFALAVVLTDTQGREITRSVLPTALPAGAQKVAVPLEGALIRASGLDGPYTVSQVILLDISGAAVQLDEAVNVHRTRPYDHRDFGG